MGERFGFSFPGGCRGFVVTGHCMEGAGITEGDLVLMRLAQPKDGDIVLAVIGKEQFMIKRYHWNHGKPVLRAASPGYPEYPITEEIAVVAVMAGLLRVPGLFELEGCG